MGKVVSAIAACATAAACLGSSAPSAATPPYDAAGHYIGVWTASNLVPPKVILGKEGVPVVKYDGLGYRDNPVTTAQYGLWAYGMYLYDETQTKHLDVAKHVGDWLISKQKTDGTWRYDFPLAFNGVTLKTNWASAMAQGQVMSLLERLYRTTNDVRYKNAAIRALRPMKRSVKNGGLMQCFFGNCKLPWLEEYPTTPPSYVLNGFMYTLIGLYDLDSIAPNSGARQLYEAGRRTVHAALPRYDVKGISAYDLTQVTVKDQKPYIAHQVYQTVHVNLLRALDTIEPDARFRFYANRWERNKARAPK